MSKGRDPLDALWLACKEVEEWSNTCPADAHVLDWDCTDCEDDYTGCWMRYFLEVRGEE